MVEALAFARAANEAWALVAVPDGAGGGAGPWRSPPPQGAKINEQGSPRPNALTLIVNVGRHTGSVLSVSDGRIEHPRASRRDRTIQGP